MYTPFTILLRLLRYSVFGEPLPEDLPSSLTEETLLAVYGLSKKHALAHLAAHALEKNGLLPQSAELAQRFTEAELAAVPRYLRLTAALLALSAAFDKANIPYIPLKGSVLRSYYPEPWMRTASDIDVLVRPEDLPAAKELLLSLGFEYLSETSYDLSFMRNGAHVELHFDLIEHGYAANANRVLSSVWEHSVPAGEGSRRELSGEFFVLHHMAHMARHVQRGGCGIRFLLDTYLIERSFPYDKEKLSALLREADLDVFAEAVTALARTWFADAPASPDAEILEDYIIRSGIYGTMEHDLAVRNTTQSKQGYVLSRIFHPLRLMKLDYPVLKRWPVLLPIMWLVRAFRILFNKDRRQKMRYELGANAALGSDSVERTRTLLRQVGLELGEK